MRPNVGDWIYTDERLPKVGTPCWVACRAKDGSRENWVAECMVYGYVRAPVKNLWHIPILDLENYEAYAWLPYWVPKAPKEKQPR